MDFSIVTPSLNMLSHLKRCHASVADQEGVSLEHIVVDGGSADGTVEWLRERPEIRSISEPDNGVYDAVNKGLRMARGDIVAYLNCDEQYLPGTLAAVAEHFRRHPEADVVFGDTLVVDANGGLIAYRKAHRMRWLYIVSSYIPAFTCSIFMHRRIVDDGMLFNTDLKVLGDAEMAVRLLRQGYRFSHLRRYLAAFTLTGHNKMIGPEAAPDEAKFRGSLPVCVRRMRRPLNLCRLVERVFSGVHFQRLPLCYDVYVGENAKRTAFIVHKASFRLPWTRLSL